MRLLAPQRLKHRGRYLLMGAALVAGSLGWLSRSGHLAVHALGAHPLPGTASPQELASLSIGRPCLEAPAGSEAPPPPPRLTGRLGLYVAVIDPVTLEPVRVVSHDPGGLFPLASAYKQAVLWALLRQKDRGTLRLTETFKVSGATQSLGNYPFDGSDVTTLAGRMIHNSDNTATDLLHRRVGLQAVQDVADELGLCHTRLILPTKDWWTAQAGLSPQFPGAAAFAALHGQERLTVAERLDADATRTRPDLLQHRLDEYFDRRYLPQTDLGTQNVSTPAEFAALVAAEYLRSGLTQDSQALQRKLMATGFGRSRMKVPLSYFGGKGGNGWRLLTYSGYLHTRGGEDVVYAFMEHGADQDYTMKNTGSAFSWINAAMKAVLTTADGGTAAPSPATNGAAQAQAGAPTVP